MLASIKIHLKILWDQTWLTKLIFFNTGVVSKDKGKLMGVFINKLNLGI